MLELWTKGGEALRGFATAACFARSRSKPAGRTAHGAPALVVVAWALLLAAWAIGNPPFAAPDEADHYIRTVGISEGHLIGRAAPGARVGATPTQIAWTAQGARVVSLPSDLDPRGFDCLLQIRSATCLSPGGHRSHPPRRTVSALTTVGNYQPLPYLAPAVLLRAGGSAPTALRLGRIAQALVVLALLGVAAYAVLDRISPLLSLLGLLLAVTPMTLFCGASLGGSGYEIAAAVAFLGCLLRLTRRGEARAARWWACATASGATLALSRAASPLWLALALLVVPAWGGRRTFLRQPGGRRAACGAVAALALAVALNRTWEAAYGSHVSLDASDLSAGLSAGVREWWGALPELVGKFGYLDVKLPLLVPLAWIALVLLLSLAAWALATPRERLVLALLLLGSLLGPPIFYALLLRPTGFGLQGRHVLPALVAVPLLAGETLYRHRDRARSQRLKLLAGIVPVTVAVLQGVAWCVNAAHYAAGSSTPPGAQGATDWTPPGGWWPWSSAALLACLCLGALALTGREAGRERRPASGAR
jgi:Predicted membrane protein (DUF2142)